MVTKGYQKGVYERVTKGMKADYPLWLENPASLHKRRRSKPRSGVFISLGRKSGLAQRPRVASRRERHRSLTASEGAPKIRTPFNNGPSMNVLFGAARATVYFSRTKL
jgi:hypothetical protein